MLRRAALPPPRRKARGEPAPSVRAPPVGLRLGWAVLGVHWQIDDGHMLMRISLTQPGQRASPDDRLLYSSGLYFREEQARPPSRQQTNVNESVVSQSSAGRLTSRSSHSSSKVVQRRASTSTAHASCPPLRQAMFSPEVDGDCRSSSLLPATFRTDDGMTN
jgi:hypothetical protein